MNIIDFFKRLNSINFTLYKIKIINSRETNMNFISFFFSTCLSIPIRFLSASNLFNIIDLFDYIFFKLLLSEYDLKICDMVI